RHGALGGLAAHLRRRLEVVGRKRAGVPVVALHAIAAAGDQRGRDRVVGATLGTQETVAVGVNRHAVARVHRGAVGIADAGIGLAAGGLGLQGQGDGGVG